MYSDYYHLQSTASPNTSGSSAGSPPMNLSLSTPAASPCFPGVNPAASLSFNEGSPMTTPSFPMPGMPGPGQMQLPHPQQFQPQCVPIGFEEAMIVQAQMQAQANNYYAWIHHLNASVHQGTQHATQASLAHYSHPYALNNHHIQAAFEKASQEPGVKGGRQPFAEWQLNILRRRFEQCDSIKIEERRELAKSVQLSQAQIKVWFQNRRFKMRKEDKHMKQLDAALTKARLDEHEKKPSTF